MVVKSAPVVNGIGHEYSVNMMCKHVQQECYIGGYKCVSLVKSTNVICQHRAPSHYAPARGPFIFIYIYVIWYCGGTFINVTWAGTNLDMHFCIRCEIMGGQWAPNQPMVCCGPIQCPTGGCQKVLRQHVKQSSCGAWHPREHVGCWPAVDVSISFFLRGHFLAFYKYPLLATFALFTFCHFMLFTLLWYAVIGLNNYY